MKEPAKTAAGVAPALGDCRVLEGILTTTGPGGVTNVSPMGPLADDRMQRLVLRPFQTSRTFQNLVATGEAVFHVTDDVELLARAAVDEVEVPPALTAAENVACRRLVDTCRWYEVRVQSIDDSAARATIVAEVVGGGRVRDFFGFNRAKHAVVEAAILATRIEFLPAEMIRDELARLEIPMQKTGGDAERRAFAFLQQYADRRLNREDEPG